MLRDNGSDMQDSYWCYGGAHWTSSAGTDDTAGVEVDGTLSLEFGVLILPSPPTRTQLYIDSTSDV